MCVGGGGDRVVFGFLFFICFAFQFESSHCTLTERITKIIMADTLVDLYNKFVHLVFPISSISMVFFISPFIGPAKVCFFEEYSHE